MICLAENSRFQKESKPQIVSTDFQSINANQTGEDSIVINNFESIIKNSRNKSQEYHKAACNLLETFFDS